MDQPTSKKDARQVLIDRLIELGTRASRPDADPALGEQDEREFRGFIQRTGTLALMPALNFLILPGRVPPQLRARLLQILATLPLRPDGVRATLEFVFSVHPSSVVGAPEESTTHKQGANITQEALKMSTQLLGSPPSGVTTEAWFSGIAPQLLALLDGKDGQELMKVASYVIGFGILGRKQYGAPGSPGWRAFAEPMLGSINPTASSAPVLSVSLDGGQDDEVVDLTRDAVLSSSESLAQGLFRLQALLISHPNPSLSRRLINPVVLPLWAAASWIHPSRQCEERYCVPAKNLLKIYLKITSSPQKLTGIIRNLLYKGDTDDEGQPWLFQTDPDGNLHIISARGPGREAAVQPNWNEIDPKVDAVLELLESVSPPEEVASVFLDLFPRWLRASKTGEAQRILHKQEDSADDPAAQLYEAKVLQKMMGKFPEQLVAHPNTILDIIEPVLREPDNTDRGGETATVALSLLSLVVTAPSFQKDKTKGEILRSIEGSLERLAKEPSGDLSTTARNLSLLLKYRDEMDDESSSTGAAPTDRQVEDRRTYQLALSYIAHADSPPPVRSEGLSLLQGLIVANSPILDIPSTLVLLSSLLNDNEDYINLRVVKAFTQLADKHPKSVTKELLEHYVDANETASVDTRLRFGEALLQVIERLGETFTGDTAKQVAEALLSTAGRRGYRPKTEKKQEREARLRAMKHREAEEAWGGEVPDMGDQIPNDERAKNEILSRIVGGWESKRGSEDVRIRASALSVLGIGIETSVGGIGASLVSTAVDLAINILTMEPEMEKGILRRAAVLLVMAFVRALDSARQTGRRLGFGLTEQSQADIKRVLQYVGQADNDGLVKQHAQDVAEGLENWQMGALMSEAQAQPPALARLAGLAINPEAPSTSSSPSARPRIEEIE